MVFTLSVLSGLALAGPPPLCQASCLTPFGQVIGKAGDVIVRSNCSVECVDPTPIMSAHPGHPDGVYTGIGWQCVEFARRAWLSQYGRVFGSVDTAADMWTAVRTIAKPNGEAVLPVVAHPNGGSVLPAAGDLVIYAVDPAQRSLRFGHVGLVVALTDDGVALAEQNWSNQPWPHAGFSRKLKNQAGKLHDPQGTILGWLSVQQGDQ